MGKSIRIPINKKIPIDKKSITIKTLTASPTSTVVKGQIQNIVELGMAHINKKRIYPENIEIALYANDKEILQQASGISTNQNGINFHLVFDRLPENTEGIQLKLLSLLTTFDVDQEITLSNIDNKPISINGQSLHIDHVDEDEKHTYINISTAETTTFPLVHLYIDNEKKKIIRNHSWRL